jgi:hypothetical protein
MNLTALTLAAVGSGAPIMLKIIFWILVLLSTIGSFGFRENPNVARGASLVTLILFAILGYYVLGF